MRRTENCPICKKCLSFLKNMYVVLDSFALKCNRILSQRKLHLSFAVMSTEVRTGKKHHHQNHPHPAK